MRDTTHQLCSYDNLPDKSSVNDRGKIFDDLVLQGVDPPGGHHFQIKNLKHFIS